MTIINLTSKIVDKTFPVSDLASLYIRALTLYRAASDPTYLERGGRNQPAPQFSARGAPIGQIMIPPQTFSVNVVYKKRIGSIGQKLGPWPQFENFRNWPIWPKARFSRISFRPYKN